MNSPFSMVVFIPAVIYFISWLCVFGSLLAREDLDTVVKLTWVLVMLFAPFSLIYYLVLAPQSREQKIVRNSAVSGTPWEEDPGHRTRRAS